MLEFSPWPCFSEEEAEEVRRTLLSNGVNQWTGEAVEIFERGFAEFCGVDHALAVSNGTVALDTALRALGIGEGDEVVVTPRSFIASASAVVLAGATPVFADVGLNSGLITPETVAPCLSESTRAILCVHLSGWPCDMDGFRALVDGREIALIEDCAQAHGATYKGRPVGGLGDIGCWSFCQDKIMTTAGEGGMVTVNDESLFRAAWSYRDHGKSYEAVFERKHPPGFRWQHEYLGTNARMTSLQAAVGTLQLERMPEWHQKRKHNAAILRQAGAEFDTLRVPPLPDGIEHAWYRCELFVEPEKLANGWSRDRIQAVILDQGVPCLAGPCPEIYRERVFTERGIGPDERLVKARRLGETSLMFLVHPTLTDAEIRQMSDVVRTTLTAASTS